MFRIFVQKIRAFSLIELLISLIIISLVVSAFTPIITKKLKNNQVALSASNQLSMDCADVKGADSKTDEYCKLCTKKQKCIICERPCNVGYFTHINTCTCKKCDDGEVGFGACELCSGSECTKCKAGYELSTFCSKKCPAGTYSDGSHECRPCPENYRCPGGTDKIACPSGCKSCDETKCLSCQNGYSLNGGSCVLCAQGHGACATCDATGCLTCQPNKQFTKSSVFGGYCLEPCSSGFIRTPDGVCVSTTLYNWGESNHDGRTNSLNICYSNCVGSGRMCCRPGGAAGVCASVGLRLPQDSEMTHWNKVSVGIIQGNALNICGGSSYGRTINCGGYDASRCKCEELNDMNDPIHGDCKTTAIATSNGNNWELIGNYMHNHGSMHYHSTYGVRCVK